jgi:hypothetical protein
MFLLFSILFGCVTNNSGNIFSNIEVEKTSQGVLISNAVNKIKLFIPSQNIEIEKNVVAEVKVILAISL